MDYEDLLGLKFKAGGRDKEGVDCFGLLTILLERDGKTVPSISSPDIEDYKEINSIWDDTFWKYLEPVEVPYEGCIVSFKIVPPYVSHLGVVLKDNKFIHIRQEGMVCVEKLNNLYWKNKISGFYKWKELN